MKALDDLDQYRLMAATHLIPDVLSGLERHQPTLHTFTDYRENYETCPAAVVGVSTLPCSPEQISLGALRLSLGGLLAEKPLGHTSVSVRLTDDEIAAGTCLESMARNVKEGEDFLG